MGGNIEFTNTNFNTMQASITDANSAIISQADDACGTVETDASPYNCGTFSMIGGTVSYLNNGYELANSLQLSTFFNGTRYSSVTFNGVTFEKNLTYGRNSGINSTLIYLKIFKTLTIENCNFSNNYIHRAIWLDSSELTLYTNIVNDQPVDHYLTHVTIKDTTFNDNTAR